jgi:predicted MPP superfamily phosphohydrolase
MALEYDLLAVTGDFGNDPGDWPQCLELARRFFAPIYPRYGAFAVLGNHDHPRLAEQPDLNLTFLRDEWTTIGGNGLEMTLAGVEQSQKRPGDVSRALAGAPSNDPAVLLAHYPSTVFELAPGRVSLMLAGHTHGGQIRLPLIGCVWAQDSIPTRLARGMHEVGGTRLHVSPGIGVSAPIRRRFLCPPEITLLTLKPAVVAPDDAPTTAEPEALNLAETVESPVTV